MATGPTADDFSQMEVRADIYYNITSLSRENVVKLLKFIVNEERYRGKTTTFYFGIHINTTEPNESSAKLFRLLPMASVDQPGNGFVSVWCKNDSRFIGRSYGQGIINDLKKYYKDTAEFAGDLKKLFENNHEIANLPLVVSELYILLVFEIARRGVENSAQSTPKKKQLDALPIESAIMNIMDLLELKVCTFEDVFSKYGKFHCFSGVLEVRKKAIQGIEKEHQRLKSAKPEVQAPEAQAPEAPEDLEGFFSHLSLENKTKKTKKK